MTNRYRYWYLSNTYGYFANILFCGLARSYHHQSFRLRNRIYLVKFFLALCKWHDAQVAKVTNYSLSRKINNNRKNCKRVENNVNFFKEPINMEQTTDFHRGGLLQWGPRAITSFAIPFHPTLVMNSPVTKVACYEWTPKRSRTESQARLKRKPLATTRKPEV